MPFEFCLLTSFLEKERQIPDTKAMKDSGQNIVSVVPAKRTSFEKASFSYIVPEELTGKLKIGSLVTVPFGKEKVRGVVWKLASADPEADAKYELKSIISLDEEFVLPRAYLKTAEWLAKYYLCSLGEAVSLFLPPQTTGKARGTKEVPAQSVTTTKTTLNAEQETIWQELKKIAKNPDKPVLLHGVTGSGKTEIYVKLVEEVLKAGKSVIFLTPEIILTPQIVERLAAEFPDKIALTHSGLTQTKRFLAYKEFFEGKKQILIGPRSALLMPSNNLGAIIIDEEQEDAYKQEKDPRYHAVTVAEKIAKETGALLVTGSATPRAETYYKAKTGDYHLLALPNRYRSLILPPAKIVDLKNEIKLDNYSPISTFLQEKIAATLAKKKQIILFLNRLGMSTFVSCRECGEVIICPNCQIPLVYHLSDRFGQLSCHHCGHSEAPPTICPKCQSLKIKYFGAGVEKIESEIKNLFPKARICKVDSRSMQKRDDYDKLLADLKSGKIDILIGTQIVAKGLDLPNVELVGIVSADVGLHIPSYRANEKTFQILTQVAGRSGRRNDAGMTVIQTYWPDSAAILASSRHDYKLFFDREIKERVTFKYPPFCTLVRIVSEDLNKEKAKKELAKVAKDLREADIDFVGPGACFLPQLRKKYRYHIILKVKKWPDVAVTEIFAKNPYLIWDVDPTDLI